MPILYDWPLEWPVWSGTLEQAQKYWTGELKLPKGKYTFIVDFRNVSDWTFWLVKASTDLSLTLNQWSGKGIDGWEWKDKRLYVYMTQASPAIPIIVYYIILAIIAVVGLVLIRDIFCQVSGTVTELGVGGKIFLGGVGVALIGGTIISLIGR